MVVEGRYVSLICNVGSGSLSGMHFDDICHDCCHLRAFFTVFYILVEVARTPIKNCSCQRTSKGVNNVLMQLFLLECPIGGGRLSTMGWMILNVGEGRSIVDSGFGVNFVQNVFGTLFLSDEANNPARNFRIWQKIDLDPLLLDPFSKTWRFPLNPVSRRTLI